MAEKKVKVTKIIRKDGITYRPAGGLKKSDSNDNTSDVSDVSLNFDIEDTVKDIDDNKESKQSSSLPQSTTSGKKKILRKIIRRADGSTVVVANGKILKIIKSKAEEPKPGNTEASAKTLDHIEKKRVEKPDSNDIKETPIPNNTKHLQCSQMLEKLANQKPETSRNDNSRTTQKEMKANTSLANDKHELFQIKRTFTIDKPPSTDSTPPGQTQTKRQSNREMQYKHKTQPRSKLFNTRDENPITPSEVSRGIYENNRKYQNPTQHTNSRQSFRHKRNSNDNIRSRSPRGNKPPVNLSPPVAQSSRMRHRSPPRPPSPRHKKSRHPVLGAPNLRSVSPGRHRTKSPIVRHDQEEQRHLLVSPERTVHHKSPIRSITEKRRRNTSTDDDTFPNTRTLGGAKDINDILNNEKLLHASGDKERLINMIQRQAEEMLKAQHDGPIDEEKRQKLKNALESVLMKRGLLKDAIIESEDHAIQSDSSDEKESHLLQRLHNKYSAAPFKDNTTADENISDSEVDDASLESVKIQQPLSDVSCSDMEVSDEEKQPSDNEDGMTPAFRKKQIDTPEEDRVPDQKYQHIQIRLGQDSEEEAFNNLASQLEEINTSNDVSNLIEAIENKIKSLLELNLEPSNLEKKIRRYQMLVAKVVMKAETIKEQEETTSDVTYHRIDMPESAHIPQQPVNQYETNPGTGKTYTQNDKGIHRKEKISRFSDRRPEGYATYSYPPNEGQEHHYNEVPLQPSYPTSTMMPNPTSAMVPNPTGTMVPNPKGNAALHEQIRLQFISQREGYHVCLLCMSETNNERQFERHLNGKRHQEAVKEKIKQMTKPVDKNKYKKHPVVIKCKLCDTTCMGQEKYNDHCLHRSHMALTQAYLKIGRVIPEPEIIQDHDTILKEKVEKIQGSSTPAVGREYMTTKRTKDCDDNILDVYYCNICKVNCTTEVQVEKHVRSKKHYLKYVKTTKPEVNIPVNITEHKRRRATTNKIVSTMKTIRKMEEAIEQNQKNLEAEHVTPVMSQDSNEGMRPNPVSPIDANYTFNANQWAGDNHTVEKKVSYSNVEPHSSLSYVQDTDVGNSYLQNSWGESYNESYSQSEGNLAGYSTNYAEGNKDGSMPQRQPKTNIPNSHPLTSEYNEPKGQPVSMQYYRDPNVHLQYKTGMSKSAIPAQSFDSKIPHSVKIRNPKSTYQAVHDYRKKVADNPSSFVNPGPSGKTHNPSMAHWQSSSTVPVSSLNNEPSYHDQKFGEFKRDINNKMNPSNAYSSSHDPANVSAQGTYSQVKSSFNQPSEPWSSIPNLQGQNQSGTNAQFQHQPSSNFASNPRTGHGFNNYWPLSEVMKGGQPIGRQPISGQQIGGQPMGGQQVGKQPMGGQLMGGQQVVRQQKGGQQLDGQQMDGQQMDGQQMDGQQMVNKTPYQNYNKPQQPRPVTHRQPTNLMQNNFQNQRPGYRGF